MFPINYNSFNSDNFYYDKYLFLLSKKLGNKYRKYPDYILNEADANIAINKKHTFRISCYNYEINDNLQLCFKYSYDKKQEKNKKFKNNRHILKKENEYELRIIPNVNNVIGLIEKIHKLINHQSYSKIKEKIKEFNIYYKGISYDSLNITNLCKVCIQNNAVFYKREPCKQIIMSKPKDRYLMDLTYIPIELIENNQYKYILNVIDHFSKFLFSYLLINKNAKSIVSKLKICFQKYGKPTQIGCDNGSEFNNSAVKSLLEKNNILLIKGKPYNPHSQGVVERVNRSIKNALICEFIDKKLNFQIESALKYVVDNYNNNYHNTIKFSPAKVFFFRR